MFPLLLIANAIWFGLAFHLFAIRNRVFAKIVVPREQRDTPVFDKLAATGTFLGGFNLAFCILNLWILIDPDVFPNNHQRLILVIVMAIAHGSQFFGNVPIALQNRKGGGVWNVTGVMRFIFITDFIFMIANLIFGIYYIMS